MYVRSAGILSEGFHVSNGVRQGGILPPYLFNIYVDDLSTNLSACRTSCSVGNTNVNLIMYADDLAVFSPSSVGLRYLISVCELYGESHDVLFNHKKSVIMIFRGS